MRFFFLVFAWLAVAAAAPSPDLIALARAGQLDNFDLVLDARFDPAGDTRFAALRDWATKLSPEDRAKFYEPLPPGPDGKPHVRERTACWNADRSGLTRAMVTAAGQSPDRASALAIWEEANEAFVQAELIYRTNLAEAQTRGAKRPTAIGRELVSRVAKDQAWREAQFKREHGALATETIGWRFWSALCHIDHDNTAWLKSIVARGEWPIISRDGEGAASDAWLIAQHADDDRDFQKQVLALLEPLVTTKEALGRKYALLFDRVATGDHRLQRYGTQFGGGKGGCLAVKPVEDHAGLDARRAAMGLDTLAANAKRMEENYHHKVCADVFDTTDSL